MSSNLEYIRWTVQVFAPTVIVADSPLQMSPFSFAGLIPGGQLWVGHHFREFVASDLRLTLLLRFGQMQRAGLVTRARVRASTRP